MSSRALSRRKTLGLAFVCLAPAGWNILHSFSGNEALDAFQPTKRWATIEYDKGADSRSVNVRNSTQSFYQHRHDPSSRMDPNVTHDDNNEWTLSLYPDVPIQLQHPRNHPRVGARDEAGNYGFKADVGLVRRTMLHRLNGTAIIADPLKSQLELGDICDYPVDLPSRLLRPVRITSLEIPTVRARRTGRTKPLTKDPCSPQPPISGPRILCAVFTHGGAVDRVTGIGETWGWRCDGFFAASTVTVQDPQQAGLGSIDLIHMGEEAYNNMWQKTRSILAYMYEHYLNDFDYFYLCGDDAHLIVENFKAYLGTLQQITETVPLHIGRTLGAGKGRIVGGGAGYALNRVALRFFNEELLDTCKADEIVSSEDRYVSRCFQSKGIWETSPMDHANRSLLQRFHPIMTLRELTHRAMKYRGMNRTVVPEDIVAANTYAWHLMEWGKNQTSMKRHHAILYRLCPNESTLAVSMESKAFQRDPIILLHNGLTF